MHLTARGEVRLVRKIRYTEQEWSTIVERARICGKAPARYVRETSLGVVPASRSRQADAALIRELGRIGLHLSRLAGKGGEAQASDEPLALESVLAEILALVRRLD